MFGYATNETKELMPMPILLAHKLIQKLSEVRRSKVLPWVRPDGKSQVSVKYEDNKPTRIENSSNFNTTCTRHFTRKNF